MSDRLTEPAEKGQSAGLRPKEAGFGPKEGGFGDRWGLLFLASSALPAGAFAWSQGLEAAAAAGALAEPGALLRRLADLLAGALATFDLPILYRAFEAAKRGEAKSLRAWDERALAGRETKELFQAETEMGRALSRLIRSLGAPAFWGGEDLGYLAAYALLGAMVAPKAAARDLGRAYAFGFLENQLAAASRLTPLGQTEARKIALALAEEAELAGRRAEAIRDEEIGSNLVGLALFSASHETLFSRLFRS